MCGSKGMTIRVTKQQEHAYEPAAARLQGSRGSKHKTDDISLILEFLDMKLCRDVCKYMIHIVVVGLDHRSSESMGTRMPTGISASAGQQGQRAQKGDNSFGLDSIATEFY